MCKQLVTELDDAQGLIDWVGRSGKHLDGPPLDWIFRGQKNADWHLAPSAWRDCSSTRLLRDGKWEPPGTSSKEQCQSEFELAQRFFILADAQGLAIPGDCPAMRRQLQSYKGLTDFDEGKNWPPQELVWLLAIAQHYGVPTRLIDWTRRPLVAAWFAAENAAKEWETAVDKDAIRKNRFVVWALRRRGDGGANKNVLNEARWQLTSAPRSSVPNLHLQSGMFTFQQVDKDDFDSDKVVIPFCESLVQCCEQDSNAEIGTILKAASVPWSEAGRLLTLLRDRFVQGATVYAGYNGVARSVMEQRWRKEI